MYFIADWLEHMQTSGETFVLPSSQKKLAGRTCHQPYKHCNFLATANIFSIVKKETEHTFLLYKTFRKWNLTLQMTLVINKTYNPRKHLEVQRSTSHSKNPYGNASGYLLVRRQRGACLAKTRQHASQKPLVLWRAGWWPEDINVETLQKGPSCLLFLGDTSIWCPAEIKGDSFSVSALRDAGEAETPKLELMPRSANTTTCVDPSASQPHWSGAPPSFTTSSISKVSTVPRARDTDQATGAGEPSAPRHSEIIPGFKMDHRIIE